MPVVINEFEVLDTPATAPATATGTDTTAPQPAPLQPEDLRRLLALSAELQLRRLAH